MRVASPAYSWKNGHVESFNAALRAEFLDRGLFLSMEELIVMLEDWQYYHNHERPHGSLSKKTPVDFQKTRLIHSRMVEVFGDDSDAHEFGA